LQTQNNDCKINASLNISGILNIQCADTIPAHAYEGNGAICKAIVCDCVTHVCGYAFAECRKLTDIKFGKSLNSIDEHAFYNCRLLTSITVPATLENIEDGAFKNCDSLYYINISGMGNGSQNVRNILADIEQETEITFMYNEDSRVSKLVIPSYHKAYTANEPARNFHEEDYGTGTYYRICLKPDFIDYEMYDSFFEHAVIENTPETVIRILRDRLVFPYALNEKHRDIYLNYIKDNKERIFNFIISNKDSAFLKYLVSDKVTVKDWPSFTKMAVADAQITGKADFVSASADIIHRYAVSDNTDNGDNPDLFEI
jgi:hypothetical protein